MIDSHDNQEERKDKNTERVENNSHVIKVFTLKYRRD